MNVEVAPNTGFVPNTGSVPITVRESPIADNFAPIHLGPTSYAKLVTGEPSRKSVNFRTLITPMRNWTDVAIPLESIGAISKRLANTAYYTLLMLDSYTPDMCMQSCGRLSYARAMIELCSNCKVFGYVLNKYPKKIVSDMRKNLNNTRQATRGVPVGPKIENDDELDSDSDVEEKETKWDDDFDPYDDELYDSHDMSDNLQAICDEFDITIHGDLKLQVINEERIEEVKEHAAYKRSQNGKLVLVGDDRIPFKNLNADSQSNVMDPFPCFSDTFGTPNTSNKVATAGTRDTPSTNGEDGSVNKVANFRRLVALTGNEVDVVVSLESVLEVKERFENYVYGFFLGKRVAYPVVENFVKNSSSTGMESMLESRPWLICKVPLDLCKWSPLVNMAKEDLKSVPCLKFKVMDIYSILFKLRLNGNRLDVQLVRSTVQTTNAKKMDNRHTKQKDTNSSKISSNNNCGSHAMVIVSYSTRTKIMTSNPFDVLNMVDNGIRVASSDSINSKGHDVSVGNNKDVTLDNEDNDSENDVKEDDNEIVSFMASQSSKGTSSSKSGGGTGKKSLYERWKADYDDIES
ncbi:hypothetical protein Tco_0072455 [Tanacetum coccineum]